MSYNIEYHFFGLNPSVYHTTNLVFHLLNSLLVFWIIYRLTQDIFICFITSVLFGIHPLHVESVAWVTERKDMLYSFFFLAAIVAYLYFRKDGRKKFYAFSLVLFLFSLMCKPSGIFLPLLLLLFDFIAGRRWTRDLLFEKTPFFLVAFVFGAAGVFGQYVHTLGHGHRPLLSPDNLFYASYAPLFYLAKTVLPIKLSCLYPVPEKSAGLLPTLYLMSPGLLLFLSAGVVQLCKYSRKALFGFSFFFLMLIPAIEIIPINRSIVYDRYMYIPSIGLFYLAAEALALVWRRNSKHAFFLKGLTVFVLGAGLAAFSILTWQRCRVWQDSLTLWAGAIKSYPGLETAYLNRGNDLKFMGRYKEALEDYRMALTLRPNDHEVFNNLGILYDAQDEYEKAVRFYKVTISINPGYAAAYHNLGITYENQGKPEQAYSMYQKALQLNPRMGVTYLCLGRWYFKKGNFDQAIEMTQRGLEFDPSVRMALLDLGVAYAEKGDIRRAEELFGRFLKEYPDSTDGLKNLAALYGNTGRLLEAKALWERALIKDPHNAETRKNIGQVNDWARSVETRAAAASSRQS